MEKFVKLNSNLFVFLSIMFGLFILVLSDANSNGITANGECSFSQILGSNLLILSRGWVCARRRKVSICQHCQLEAGSLYNEVQFEQFWPCMGPGSGLGDACIVRGSLGFLSCKGTIPVSRMTERKT